MSKEDNQKVLFLFFWPDQEVCMISLSCSLLALLLLLRTQMCKQKPYRNDTMMIN